MVQFHSVLYIFIFYNWLHFLTIIFQLYIYHIPFSIIFLGASLLKEVYCGHTDRQLCLLWECEGWWRAPESEEESKEASCQNELQVITSSFSLILSNSFFVPLDSYLLTHSRKARTFFIYTVYVTSSQKADYICILVVYKMALMRWIYDHFLWLGSKAADRSIGPLLPSVKSSSPNCCHSTAKSEVSFSVQDIC